ncbi:hypothetical protein J6590_060108 [Homalodisca vitripennis]|nr:hypothetical protein J6590_060108 [Homalodisca vitripennis]
MERVILDDSSDIDRELGGDSDLSSLFSSDGQSKYNSSDYSNEDTDSDYNHRPNDVNNPDDLNVQLSNPEGDIYFAVGLNSDSLDNPDVEFDRPNDENNDVANDPNVQFIVDSIHNKYEETQGQWKNTSNLPTIHDFVGQEQMTYLQYRDRVIESFIQVLPTPRPGPSRRSSVQQHFPKKLEKRVRCPNCRLTEKKRKTTFFVCGYCKDDENKSFGLCMSDCFKAWHEK